MKIRIIAVGRVKERYIVDAINDFRSRLRHYETVEEVDVSAASGADPERAVREEGERIFRHLDPTDSVWLLERTGKQIDSKMLSRRIDAAKLAGTTRLAFVIAGTYGASEALIQRADFLWSLSALTFLHEWARAIVFEQLYRAAKIARNEAYHH